MRLIVFAALVCGAAGGSWTYDAQADWPGVCQTGKHQSPINFRSEDVDRENIGELRFHYDCTGAFIVTGDGKSVRVYGFDGWQPRPYIDGGGLDGNYTLSEIHFHWYSKGKKPGSEHSINGTHYPIEIHMVHRGQIEGQEHVAVVAIFVQPYETKERVSFPNGIFELFKTIAAIDNVKPTDNHVDRSAFSGERWFKPEELLPADRTRFYRYEGSLTTPDCDEIVTWTVMESPHSIHSDLTGKLINLRMRNGKTEFVHNQRQQQSRRRFKMHDPNAPTPSDPNAPSRAAHGLCAFWPLAATIAALLIVDVNVPVGNF